MGSTTGTASEHRYQTCRDQFCDRFLCRVYQEGRRDGYDDGYRDGWDKGYAEGYSAGYGAGFRDGMDACPRAHS